MVDFNYANDDAVLTIGALKPYDANHGHPDGWTHSVIDKIKLEMTRTPTNPRMGSNADQVLSKFSPEERDAWKWYQEEVVPPAKWKKLVEEYDVNKAKPSITHSPFDPNTTYVPKPGSQFTPPPGVKDWHGADNKGGDLVVSHEAINYFIKSLGSIAGDGGGILLDARKTLGAIDPRPGGFARAEVMRQRVRGASAEDPGLQGDTMALLASVHSALFDLQANLRTLLNNYKNAEEFNKLTADKLGTVMEGSYDKIGGLDSYGKTSSTGGGGGNGGGGGTGGAGGTGNKNDK